MNSDTKIPLALSSLCLLLILTIPSRSQDGWTAQSSGITDDLEGVYFVTEAKGWAVGTGHFGSRHIILHTNDGGSTWTEQRNGSGATLFDVHFIGESHGWAVGQFGTIFRTTDSGTTWTQQVSGDDHNLFGVHFIDDQTGWATGDWWTMLSTVDGGASWLQQTIGSTQALEDVFFIDANEGWTAGTGGDIFHTTDGGITWDPQTSNITLHINRPFFVDNLTGWVTAALGTILKTTDGGATWNPQTSGTLNNLKQVHFTDHQNGWAVGDEGTIVHTSDGGATWTLQASGTTEDLRALSFVDGSTGWIVGFAGTILHTNTGGNPPPQVDDAVAHWPFNGNADDESGNGNDGTVFGATLTEDRFGNPDNAYDFDGTDDYIDFGDNSILLLRDDISMSMWIDLESLPLAGDAEPLIQRGAWGETEATNNIWRMDIMNSGGTPYYRTGHEYGSGTGTGDLLSVSPVTNGWHHVVLVRDHSDKTYTFYIDGVYDNTLPYSENATGGEETRGYMAWSPSQVILYPDCKLDDIRVFDRILTEEDILFLYNEPPPDPPPTIPCEEITRFQARCQTGGTIQARVILASGDYEGETVEFTIDDSLTYGVTVNADRKATLSIGVFSTGPHKVALTEPSGCFDPIRTRCLEGISSESEFWDHEQSWEIPVATALFTNYPNPFNPSTTIRYGLSEDSHVTIGIYSILGQLVKTLVDDYQTAGYDEVRWDGRDQSGSRVSSGIYLFRMSANDYMETKKMILMK